MNTPIVKISDDQNEITHESGVVTVFEKGNLCRECCYNNMGCYCFSAPCFYGMRKDRKSGIFKLKQQTT